MTPEPATDRRKLLAEIFARANGRKVYGYRSCDGHGGVLTEAGICERVGLGLTDQRRLSAEIDRVTIEGSREPWTPIPKGETK